ncbi:BglG family transcription antiterminator [Aquibacillus sediminis]|uniref:BglG family transcription antiterminator n=1 Tax=Aquibacillus sediminis TaxID=2574734 RepID=UPI001109BD99|nr:BglG family transcription antiterminator [Aquibacillus sediminis]
MNDRQKELLRILLVQKKETVNIMSLASQLECAEKTVRNDLKKLEEILVDFPSATLIRKPGIGIMLEVGEADRAAMFDRLLATEPKTTEDRFLEIAYHLLVSDKAVTIQDLTKHYYVAKGTIKKELDQIATWLNGFDLELISKPRLGNYVEGTEFNKRSAIAHLSELLPTLALEKNYVLDLFLPYEITTVKKALRDLQQHHAIAFTDGAMESLLVHALIMIKRTRQKSPVYVPEEEKEAVCGYKEYNMTSTFFEQLESVFRITFPEDERIYFTWHLISGKKKEDEAALATIADDFLNNLVADLTTKLSKLTLTSFESDAVLTRGLAVHIHSVINRIKYGFPITNPLLADVKKMYPYMFNMVMIALDEIREKYDLDVPEDEAAYLVLHFQAAIERLEGTREQEKKTLIVCHMGVGTSYLLEAKVKQYYQDITILACVGQGDVDDFLEKTAVDFIISTVPLDRIHVPHVVISPLLEAKDKENLNQFMKQLEQKKAGSQDAAQLAPLIRGDLVFLGVDKEHPYQVVELLGQALFQKGFVTESFTHHAIMRESKSATSIGGGVAIPHGSPSMVHQSAIAVAVLKEPIEWGTEFVSLVFMLAFSKEDQRLNRAAVSQIATICEHPSYVQSLVAADRVKDFLDNLS